ncbi:MAG: GTPase Era [Deltaproteobacteria bacterium]|nr:GTPase Era [Deltaproteobacteria bacterium]
MSDPATQNRRAGFIALVGRPNVGKSTLLNQVVGTTLAAVANKPQTTRNRIVGILHRERAQLVFVDTPGIHHPKTPMNARLVSTARQALGDADVVVLVLDAAAGVTAADRHVAADVRGRPRTVIALTKADLVSRNALIPACAAAQALLPDAELVPVSGKTGDNVERLLEVLTAKLPTGPPLYPPDQVTEQSERFLAAEIVREKVIAQTRDEVPYTTAVVVEAFREEPARHLVVITASVIVERDSQKGIVIGERGQRIRDIGKAARLSLERRFGCRIYLELHVKVVPEWSRNPRMLGELGI